MAARRTKRSDGRFTVTLTHYGRRHFFYGKTQAEAEAKAAAARERLTAGAPVRDATRTLNDWLGEWRTTLPCQLRPLRFDQAPLRRLTRRHVEPVIGALPLERSSPRT